MNKIVYLLGFITASRFFGLFLVMPVLSLYALELDGANEALIGLLVGGYAVMQMIFQVPFGMASDRFGRRKILVFGLFIFILGSVICALAANFWVMFLGRLLQGSGAVGAVASAMISDAVPELKRGKAMAVMGMMMGASFTIAMVLSPILAGSFGLGSLFWLSAVLSLFCIILIYALIPSSLEAKIVPSGVPIGFNAAIKDLKTGFKNRNLALINITNFMQKMLMSAAFVIIPIVLVKQFEFEYLWAVYAGATLFGFLAMGVAGAMDGKRGLSKAILVIGVALFIISWAGFGVSGGAISFAIFVAIFFIAFNLHEPVMQSVASRFALRHQRGAVLGVFNSFGYAGSFFGALLAGWGLEHCGVGVLGAVATVLSIFWLISLIWLENPAIYKTVEIDGALTPLNGVSGVVESYLIDGVLIVKYDSRIISEHELLNR